MARMMAGHYLWTILFLSQLTLLKTDAFEVRTHRLPFETDQLLMIPAPDQSQVSCHEFRDLLETQCDFLSRAMVTNRPNDGSQNVAESSPRCDVVENDLPPKPAMVDPENMVAEYATCPTESSVVADCQPINAQNNNATDRLFGQFWIETWQFIAPHKEHLVRSQRWLEMEIEAFEGDFRGSVASVADLISARIGEAIATIDNPPSHSSSMTRVSHSRIIAPDVTSESQLEDANELKVNEAVTAPINIDDSADPYWQYYEDCDRWGVNFVMLLSDPSIANCDFDVELPNPDQLDVYAAGEADKSEIGSVSDHPTLEVWFTAIALIGRDAWQTVQNWVDICEFHSVEMESVDLDSIKKTGSDAPERAWWEDLQIEFNDRIEILKGNVTEIFAYGRHQTIGSREANATTSAETRK